MHNIDLSMLQLREYKLGIDIILFFNKYGYSRDSQLISDQYYVANGNTVILGVVSEQSGLSPTLYTKTSEVNIIELRPFYIYIFTSCSWGGG